MKKNLLIIVITLLLTIAILLIILYSNQKVAVLGYHNIYGAEANVIEASEFLMNEENFREQMEFIKEKNYKTLMLDEFYCWQKGECKQPRKSVLITFDDGYYYNYKYAFPILKELELNATVFIVGIYIGEENPSDDSKAYMSFSQLEDIKKNYKNIEIASHSYNMHAEHHVGNMKKAEILTDIRQNENIIETNYYAYPGGRFSEDMISALKEEGFKMAFGFGKDDGSGKKPHRKATKKDNEYVIPRLNIGSKMDITKFKMIISLPIM